MVLSVILLTVMSCEKNHSDALSAFDVYCEMVENDAKPLALHYPMDPGEVDLLWTAFEEIADKRSVRLFREDSFPVSYLFPEGATAGKSVVLIYNGTRLTQYKQWKSDLKKSNTTNRKEQIAMARRLGRLLGYSPQGVNNLLRKNTDFRDIYSFDVRHQNTHLYYEDLPRALDFYKNVLGLKQKDSITFLIGATTSIQLNKLDTEHPTNDIKSTAIAFLTDQLPQWYNYVLTREIPVKYTYKTKEGSPHDGFVVIDPEGYLLEFEMFKQHHENERFIAALEELPRIKTSVDSLNFYGSITWTYHKDLLKVQNFYEEELGFPLVADQGWTKIFRTSSTGFIGLVDERRGMENYSDIKAVEVEWKFDDIMETNNYLKEHYSNYDSIKRIITGPEKYIYRIR